MAYNRGAWRSNGIRTRTKPIAESYDEDHSDEENRFVAIGPTRVGVVVVVYTERQDDVIRIVSARKATTKEVELFRKYYGSINE
jgi:uncharacterized protein